MNENTCKIAIDRKRVYEVASEFGIANQEAVVLLQVARLPVKNHLSWADVNQARKVLRKASVLRALKRHGVAIRKRSEQED